MKEMTNNKLYTLTEEQIKTAADKYLKYVWNDGSLVDPDIIVKFVLAEAREGSLRTPHPAPQPTPLIDLLMQFRTYFEQRDDPNGANWCMKTINEAKELGL